MDLGTRHSPCLLYVHVLSEELNIGLLSTGQKAGKQTHSFALCLAGPKGETKKGKLRR